MARFLSDEFLQEASTALADDVGFTDAIDGVKLSVKFRVSEVPERGDVVYTLAVDNGAVAIHSDPDAAADVTISNNYQTAVGISTGKLNTQMAFFTGKIKVDGNMGVLLSHSGVISAFANALSDLDVEY